MQRTNAQESARARKAGPGALSTLYRKELADHLHSARFFIIFALLGITSLAIADMAYSTDGIMGFANMMDNYKLELTLNRISPYYLDCEAVSTLLSPNVRTLGITTLSSLSGIIASYLSFDQSLLLVWPHLTCMIALVMAAFTVAYISFMRQEIRA